MTDPDLDSLKRTIDLAEYAQSLGYEDRPRDSVPGIAVLARRRDGACIAVAPLEGGGIYARIPDYSLRAEDEREELARRRLRDCIGHSGETGTLVELVRGEERRFGRPEPDLEAVRRHLASWQNARELAQNEGLWDPGGALRGRMRDGTPSPTSHDFPGAPEVQARLDRWREAQRIVDGKLAPHSGHTSQGPASTPSSPTARPNSELVQRQYDWSRAAPNREPAANSLGRRTGRDEDRGR